mgnify:CR=1 FL=1
MNRNTAKKIGKRGANTWGRQGTPKLKRAASKAVRKEPINDEYDIEKSEYSRRLDVLALKGLDELIALYPQWYGRNSLYE